MDLHNLITNSNKKNQLKVAFLVAISYFFLGMTEGSFIWFSNGRDTLINFSFTLFCVGSSWMLFRSLYNYIAPSNILLKSLAITILLCSYITLLNWLYIEGLWQESLVQTPFFYIVLPLAVPLFLAWSFGYHWFIGQLIQNSKAAEIEYLMVNHGKKRIPHPLSKTLAFVVEHRLVFLVSDDGKRYIIERTLNELEEMLNAFEFFRANRQLLISKKVVESYEVAGNDKLNIVLSADFDDLGQQTISRYKAPAFRKWLHS